MYAWMKIWMRIVAFGMGEKTLDLLEDHGKTNVISNDLV